MEFNCRENQSYFQSLRGKARKSPRVSGVPGAFFGFWGLDDLSDENVGNGGNQLF